MSQRDRLGEPPTVNIEVVGDHTGEASPEEGFLRLRRLTLRNRYGDGHRSESYRYDLVERDAIDAVAIVLVDERGPEPRVCLRSVIRPPMSFRPHYDVPFEDDGQASGWEIPAGLIEPGECGDEGLRHRAAEETWEEVGLRVTDAAFERLGPAVCLSPGVIGERLWFLWTRVDASVRQEPEGDGSPTEERASVRFVPLSEALAATRDGRIADVKTEVGLRRIAERLEGGAR